MGAMVLAAGAGLGGPGAMGTTPVLLVVVEVEPLWEERGDSDAAAELGVLLRRLLDLEVPEGAMWLGVALMLLPPALTGLTRLFLRDFSLREVEVPPPPGVGCPVPRLRFLMISVLRERGLTTPCSFKKRPQALQRGLPSGFRRHRGVVWV